jgi:hypothetical protein
MLTSCCIALGSGTKPVGAERGRMVLAAVVVCVGAVVAE